jgi:hypothetical protein
MFAETSIRIFAVQAADKNGPLAGGLFAIRNLASGNAFSKYISWMATIRMSGDALGILFGATERLPSAK